MTEPTFHPLTSNDLMDVVTLRGELYSHQHMRFDQRVPLPPFAKRSETILSVAST